MTEPYFTDDAVTLYHGDNRDILKSLPSASLDACVTDPPYELAFMGRKWDASGIAYDKWLWAEVWRVLKPGGHLLAFGGTRTWHRLACAIEDAGFEVRDSIAYMYGSGFPKSLNLSKALQDNRCQCSMGHSEHGKPSAQHDLSGLRGDDVSQAVGVGAGEGPLLLAGVQEQGAPAAGRSQLSDAKDGLGEPRMEGRRDVQAPEGELRRPALRSVPARVPSHGEVRRVCHGTPARDGKVDRSAIAALGSGEPHQSRPEGQQAGEPGVVPEQRGSQAWGGWPVCRGCGKPSIPDGLGTALKPAFEPIVVARKPLQGTVAENVQRWGTGAINVDGCRIGTETLPAQSRGVSRIGTFEGADGNLTDERTGRWPANVILDESQAAELDRQSGVQRDGVAVKRNGVTSNGVTGWGKAPVGTPDLGYGGEGGASRFFYTAKASTDERPRVDGVAHPTVKPLDLMQYLVRLVTPPGGTVLEPFAGSGTTLEACIVEGFKCVGIEITDEYLPLIMQRITKPIEVTLL